jgi:hypothetical protein
MIVWQGHPSGLKADMIEKHLQDVRLTPTFDLPKSLSKAKKSLDKGKYASGIKELRKHIEGEDADAAQEAIDKVIEYGQSQLDTVESYAEEGLYGDASAILERLEKSFKGTEIGDDAKAKRTAWKKDKAIKVEIEGCKILDKVELLARSGNTAGAAKMTMKITKGKKYEGTKVRERAEARLEELKEKLGA